MDLWEAFRNKKIFITGGTGFFGKWIVDAFIYANNKLSLNLQITLLVRNKSKCISIMSTWLNLNLINYIEGDVRSFEFPESNYDYILHAATDTSLTHAVEKSAYNLDVIINGTKHVLDFAKYTKARDVLYISSGAVYGKQPQIIGNIEEDFEGAPRVDDVTSIYGEGKRIGELLSLQYSDSYGFNVKIARCFTFVGPYMKLDGDLAIGNFIKDYINNDKITVKGDGSPFRSYLYISELVVWLLFILIKGKNCTPYNVGSDKPISIKSLAELIAGFGQKDLEVCICQKPVVILPSRYVPSVTKVNNHFGITQKIDLDDMIKKTINWAFLEKENI